MAATKATKGTTTALKARRKAKPKAKPKAVVQHVLDTLEGELTKLEKQTGKTSQDRERASRALSQMVGSLEKTVDMQRDLDRVAAKSGSAKAKQEAADAEEKRRTLAERLEKLGREQRTRKSSRAD